MPIALKCVRFINNFFGAVAQLGEHLVRNEGVGGSTPPSSTKDKTLFNYGNRLKAKAVFFVFFTSDFLLLFSD